MTTAHSPPTVSQPRESMEGFYETIYPVPSNSILSQSLPHPEQAGRQIQPPVGTPASAMRDDHVEAVTDCRLPPFWKAHPDLWFLQVEAICHAHRVRSDESKFYLVVAALDADSMTEIADVLRSPPKEGQYMYLKQQIISRFTDSPDRQLQKLFTELELGDRKPSQLLRQMRTLAGASASEDLLRVKWLALLPANAQKILRVLTIPKLDELALAADQLMEGDRPYIMAAGHAPARSPSPGRSRSPERPSSSFQILARELADVKASMAALTSLVRELSSRVGSSGGNYRPSRSRTRSWSKDSPVPSRSASPEICFYHDRFGNEARHCRSPCKYAKKASLN